MKPPGYGDQDKVSSATCMVCLMPPHTYTQVCFKMYFQAKFWVTLIIKFFPEGLIQPSRYFPCLDMILNFNSNYGKGLKIQSKLTSGGSHEIAKKFGVIAI